MKAMVSLSGRAGMNTAAFSLAYAVTALPVLAAPIRATDLVILAVLAALLVWISCVDLARFTIPDVATFAVAVLGAVHLLTSGRASTLPPWLVGASLLMAAFWLAGAYLYRRLGTEGLGIGDAKLIGAATLWVGPLHIWTLLFLAAAGGIAAAVVSARSGRGEPIPFGPFLSFALYLLAVQGMLQ